MGDKKKKFAVFDIDGTIFRSSLVIELTKELVDEGLFPKNTHSLYREEFQRWLDRNGSYEDYINKVVDVYKANIVGVKLKDAIDIAERLMIFHKNRVYRYTRDLVQKLSSTHFLLAISHSPYHVVEPFCRAWGFQKVYALMYEVDENEVFTGDVEYEDLIKHKGRVLERAMDVEGLTRAGSVGVGDSESDIAMLKMVSRPIAFNPNTKLYQAAKRNHWDIVVERKDVIYRI